MTLVDSRPLRLTSPVLCFLFAVADSHLFAVHYSFAYLVCIALLGNSVYLGLYRTNTCLGLSGTARDGTSFGPIQYAGGEGGWGECGEGVSG